MNPTAPERKLAAVLSADVAGYSRLMGADEEGTLRQLMACRQVFSEHMQQHRGRVVNAPGDAILAEFASVVDAVACAVAIQQRLADLNAGLPDDERMRFRIGINLGDVMVQGEDLFGDGVNIAARLQALAEPGGICISGTAFDQVEGKLALRFRFLGEQRVKNIAKPVRTYAVRVAPGAARQRFALLRWIGKRKVAALVVGLALAVAGSWLAWRQWPHLLTAEKPAANTPSTPYVGDQPSIAVLPFQNLSGDPAQERIGDGLSEDILTLLAKIPRLLVIGRNSSFTYKGKAVDVVQVGRDLNVRYVLEGSVQQSGKRLRVTAQLIDAATGHHVWADRYDREMNDLFAIQDDISQHVTLALQVHLTEENQGRIFNRPNQNLEAWALELESLDRLRRYTEEDNNRARDLSERALKINPECTSCLARIGWTHLIDAQSGWTPDSTQSMRKAQEFGELALNRDRNLVSGLMLLGTLALARGDLPRALDFMNRGVALQPSSADDNAMLGGALIAAGQPHAGLDRLAFAKRINPRYPASYDAHVGRALLALGRHEESISTYRQVVARIPGFLHGRLGLIAALVANNQTDEARTAAKQLLAERPSFSIAAFLLNSMHSKDAAVRETFADRLRQAGLPE